MKKVESVPTRLDATVQIAGHTLPVDTNIIARIAQRIIGKDGCDHEQTKLVVGFPSLRPRIHA